MVIPTLPSIILIGQTDQFAADWQIQVARAERILSQLPATEQIDVMQTLKTTIEFGSDAESRLHLFVAFNDTFEGWVR
jgi:hypothetical protein